MTLNAGEMLVLQALETGLENAKENLMIATSYSTKQAKTYGIKRYESEIVEFEVAIDIVKGWGTQTER